MSEGIERVARAIMNVRARLPGNRMDFEVPVLALDPDFDDLPLDHTQGTEDDEITQEAVLRLARAAIEALRDPTQEMVQAGWDVVNQPCPVSWRDPQPIFTAMIDAALRD